MARPWRPDMNDVDRLSKGGAAKNRGTGNFNIPHRLNADERPVYEAAKKKGYLQVRGTGYRKGRKGNPLPNIWRQWCDAKGMGCVVIEQDMTGAGGDVVVADLAPLRLRQLAQMLYPQQASAAQGPPPPPPLTPEQISAAEMAVMRQGDVVRQLKANGHENSHPHVQQEVQTKWVVSAVVTGVLLWQHNAAAAWCVVGAVFSSFLCKVMKHIINQQRPENARKRDPGMPSSHANSLNFLSVYAAMSLHHYCSSQAAASALALFTLGVGVFLTWLRVALGYHTLAQVLVGAALGAATAACWFEMGVTNALPALQGSAAATTALYAATGLAMAAFGVKNVLSWAEERRHHQHNSMTRQQQPQQEEQGERELMKGLHNVQKPQQLQQVWGHQEEGLPVGPADAQSKGSIAPAAAWAG
eukprot:gene7501-7711_t